VKALKNIDNEKVKSFIKRLELFFLFLSQYFELTLQMPDLGHNGIKKYCFFKALLLMIGLFFA
jgi:hypothetical protein